VVRENLETVLLQLREDGSGLPRYVEDELRRYLKCGLLSEGFARVVCEDCYEEILLAFSCKGRGFCPSCLGRRMSDTAAHLVDRVLQFAPYRQWVLAYPKRLRLAFARDARATTESAAILMSEAFRWQRRRAKALGVTRPMVGAVSVTQRFGSRLDVNIHHHAVLPDGVFVEDAHGVGFVRLDPPQGEELLALLARIVKRTLKMAQRRGLLEEESTWTRWRACRSSPCRPR
jgi:hypothetical protein